MNKSLLSCLLLPSLLHTVRRLSCRTSPEKSYNLIGEISDEKAKVLSGSLLYDYIVTCNYSYFYYFICTN